MRRALVLLGLLFVPLSACAAPVGDDATDTTRLGGKADFGGLAEQAAARIDRMGHVEVGPLVIADLPVADRFNREMPFSLHMSDANRADYFEALQKGLLRYDNYDSYPISFGDFRIDALEHLRARREGEVPDPTRLDWVDDLDAPHPLMEVYMTDALFVDVSKPCPAEGGYFEPELATLRGEPHQTCGGRLPDEDIIDKFATLLINGPWAREVHEDDDVDPDDADPYPDRGDTVRVPWWPTEDTFPYLSEPYTRFHDGWL